MKRILILIFALLFMSNCVFALSNQSVEARELLNDINLSISKMQERQIPTSRIIDKFGEVNDLYKIKLDFEMKNRYSNYDIVFTRGEEALGVSEDSFIAQDELSVFNEVYLEYEKDINLSNLRVDYDEMLESFSESRFEEVIELIPIMYEKLSEERSRQTATNLFYSATKNRIKIFFTNNWKAILIVLTVAFILFLIFKKAIFTWRVLRKIKNLKRKREVVLNLIKDSQRSYFTSKSTSKSQYEIRMRKFEEMIRDIDRQVPLLKEDLMKFGKK